MDPVYIRNGPWPSFKGLKINSGYSVSDLSIIKRGPGPCPGPRFLVNKMIFLQLNIKPDKE